MRLLETLTRPREADWYMAKGVIFNRHGDHDYYDWKDVETVAGEDDVRDEKFSNYQKHPKAFFGLYSHAAFREKCDTGCASLINAQQRTSSSPQSSVMQTLIPIQRRHIVSIVQATGIVSFRRKTCDYTTGYMGIGTTAVRRAHLGRTRMTCALGKLFLGSKIWVMTGMSIHTRWLLHAAIGRREA